MAKSKPPVGPKLRCRNWWWGRWVSKGKGGRWFDESGNPYPADQVDHTFERYNEKRHGLHNLRPEDEMVIRIPIRR